MNAKEIPKGCQKKNAGKPETSNEADDEEWIEPTDTPYDVDFALAIYEKGRGYPKVLCMRCCTTLSNLANAHRHFIRIHTVRRLKKRSK